MPEPAVTARLVLHGQQPIASALDWVAKRALQRAPTEDSEISRICNLPISEPLTEEEMEHLQRLHVKPEAYADGFRLQRVQLEALQAFLEHGLFGPIEVGGGKTLVSLRAAGIAIEQGLTRIILCVPNQVYPQLIDHDIGWARKRVHLAGCSFYGLGGLSPEKRMNLAGSRRGCWVIPYSLLSRPDTFEMLEKIQPELLIFDEAHLLKNKNSARTRRIRTFVRDYEPKVVCLSGTMTSKSLIDYAHLLSMSLGKKAPIPLDGGVSQEWASVLDSEQAGTETFHGGKTSAGALRPLINWAKRHFPSEQKLTFDIPGFRRAFQHRLLTAPGVVSSPADSLGTSLHIENQKPPVDGTTGADELKRLHKQLNDLWVSPSGDEIEHAMLVWKANNELTAGIYNSLVWPDAGQLSERQRISTAQAEDLLKRSKDYHILLQQYHKELRSWFSHHPHKPGLDTPMLIGASIANYGADRVGRDLAEAWQRKETADFEGRIIRDSVPMRVCDYKVRAALAWAPEKLKERQGGIVFYYHQEFGKWIYEEMKAAGIPCVFCPAGDASNNFLVGEGAAERCLGKILICSISAHGTGKNLQFMGDILFAQLPANEMQAQQAIARTHRTGQKRDEVNVTTLICNDHDDMALAAILNDAIYVNETTNSARRVLIATWNPMPTIYGSGILIRAGANAMMLSARQQQLLSDKFNKS